MDRVTRGGVRTAGLLLAGLLLAPLHAEGQLTLLERGQTVLDVGGYARTLTGVYHVAYDVPGQAPTTGFNAEVVRLKWSLRVADRMVLEVHDRLQVQVSSEARSLGNSVAGFGVSAVPGRSVDLRSDFIQRERVQAWHDVDRLSLTIYTGQGDLTVGRQAITWGVSSLFPVADLWAQFSPFELDTEEKPGIDAVRFLTYPLPGWEVDAVIADRGSRDDLSAGVRASVSLSWADLHLAGGKFWNEAIAMAGLAVPVGSFKVRGEAVLPYDLDDDEIDRIRATLGVDWLGGEWLLGGELHYNGVGATDASGYDEILQDPRYARGESYYLGRTYAGALAVWTPGNDRLSFALNAMANLRDPSMAVTPVVSYDLGQSVRLSGGGLLAVGDAPTFAGVPRFYSEYGAYGSLLFTRMSVYF